MQRDSARNVHCNAKPWTPSLIGLAIHHSLFGPSLRQPLAEFPFYQILKEIQEAEEAGVPAPVYTTDHKMAYSVMDFLFASQDASTASLVWTMTQMAEHPDVLEKVSAGPVTIICSTILFRPPSHTRARSGSGYLRSSLDLALRSIGMLDAHHCGTRRQSKVHDQSWVTKPGPRCR